MVATNCFRRDVDSERRDGRRRIMPGLTMPNALTQMQTRRHTHTNTHSAGAGVEGAAAISRRHSHTLMNVRTSTHACEMLARTQKGALCSHYPCANNVGRSHVTRRFTSSYATTTSCDCALCTQSVWENIFFVCHLHFHVRRNECTIVVWRGGGGGTVAQIAARLLGLLAFA